METTKLGRTLENMSWFFRRVCVQAFCKSVMETLEIHTSLDIVSSEIGAL